MRMKEGIALDFDDVLLIPKRSKLESRKVVELTRKFKFKNCKGWEGIPIIASNMTTVATPKMAEVMCSNKMLTFLHKYIKMDDKQYIVNNNVHNIGLTIGLYDTAWHDLEDDLKYIESVNKVNFICLDAANGYTEKFLSAAKELKTKYTDKIIIAGNVVTPEAVEALILAGVDIVKVGIGSGASCTTRRITGVGYPQLSAVIECADAAHGLGGYIISDGGCRHPSDVVKAFAAGADFVMLGSMLAGTTESGGELIEKDGRQYKEYYGMSSKKANEKFAGGLKDYKASEGRELLIPYKGSVINILQEITGGLRSACTYIGAKRLKDLSKCATFIRVNKQLNNSLEKYE